jgi:hypothetical protein
MFQRVKHPTCSISTLPPPHRRKKSSPTVAEEEHMAMDPETATTIVRIDINAAKQIELRREEKLLRPCSICTRRRITPLLLRDALPVTSSTPSTDQIRPFLGNRLESSSTCRLKSRSKKAAPFASTPFRAQELQNAGTVSVYPASFGTCSPTRSTIPTRIANAPVALFRSIWSTFDPYSSSRSTLRQCTR